MKYWWVSLIVVIICLLEIAAVYLLRKHRKISAFIATVIGLIVLAYKSAEYIENLVYDAHVYPIEFSQISYFTYSVIAVAGVEFMMPVGAYFGFATGFGNTLAVIASPDTMVAGFGSWTGLVVSLGIHNLLFFGGLLICFNTVKFKKRSAWAIPAAILLSVVFIILVKEKIFYPDIASLDNVVFLKIIDGSILEYLMPAEKVTAGFVAGWYIFVIALLTGTCVAMYALNARAHRKDEEKGLECVCPGILPQILYAVGRVKKRRSGKNGVSDGKAG